MDIDVIKARRVQYLHEDDKQRSKASLNTVVTNGTQRSTNM